MTFIQKVAGGLVIVGAVAAGITINWQQFTPSCTTRIVDTELAIGQSDRDLQALATSDQPTKCSTYTRRVELLAKAVLVSEACGPPQATKRSVWPIKNAELEFYKRLLAEQCS